MLKKFIAAMLAVVLAFSALPAAGMAANQKVRVQDLILDINVPEVTRVAENSQLVLHPL